MVKKKSYDYALECQSYRIVRLVTSGLKKTAFKLYANGLFRKKHQPTPREEKNVSEGEATQFVRFLASEAGKAAGCDEIRLRMLKTAYRGGILWLTHVY
ncbi:unnamed protein product [Clavelina lepadiformis]|uniref:Uncharacterized protein n=1 Tax=Clavelina lepadiformis TaxID=159417 RepID=A0ABP0FIH3_CLALP